MDWRNKPVRRRIKPVSQQKNQSGGAGGSNPWSDTTWNDY